MSKVTAVLMGLIMLSYAMYMGYIGKLEGWPLGITLSIAGLLLALGLTNRGFEFASIKVFSAKNRRLTMEERDILVCLANRADEGVAEKPYAKTIAKRVGQSLVAAESLLAKLEQEGLVLSEKSGTEGRVWRITKDGRAAINI